MACNVTIIKSAWDEATWDTIYRWDDFLYVENIVFKAKSRQQTFTKNVTRTFTKNVTRTFFSTPKARGVC